MNTIARLKDSISKDLKNQKGNPHYIGLKIFQIGILFLASAPAISFILLIFSSFIGSFKRNNNFFSDKFNLPFILVAILMIFNCLIITFFKKDIQSNEISKIWVGLLNWLPFFWCFWGFQPFLDNQHLRIKTGKLFIIGSLPVLISGFSQYFLKNYGPYYFFNNLIIWYQRPIGSDAAVTGLFNNQNYAGAWLSIIFPLCLVFLWRKNNNRFRKIILFMLCLSFVYMIILTSSRGAIFSIFISLLLLSDSNKNKLLDQKELKPYPLSSLKVAAQSVDSSRNPFSIINKINSEVFVNPRKHFILNGLVQSGNQLNAILKSSNGVNFYQEGDYINKEFKVQKIDLDQETVVISNGEKEFKIALN